MNKKVSLGFALALIPAVAALTFAVTMVYSRSLYSKLISDLSRRVEMYETIDDIDNLVNENYYYASSISKEELKNEIAGGYVSGLGDGHSRYMTAAQYDEYCNTIEGTASGTGITAVWDDTEGGLCVSDVSVGSPADVVGIKAGDMLTAIGGKVVTEKNYEQLLELFKGERLTTVSITFLRDGKSHKESVMRGYDLSTVTYKTIDAVGYIRITAFYNNTPEKFSEALKTVMAQGVRGIIFDVRGTSEGSIENAAKILDYLVPLPADSDKSLVIVENKTGKVIESYSSTAGDIDIPMAVLINSDTSGAAELFAADLSSFGKAELVGNTTSGNGTVQELFRLANSDAVLLTVAVMTPYSGESFDGVGVTPDSEVSLTEEQVKRLWLLTQDEDAQLKVALNCFE